MQLAKKQYQGMEILYRLNSRDERYLAEVLEKCCYRRKRLDFDVEHGEVWLDLGASIGEFYFYCRARGAVCTAFEAEKETAQILKRNAGVAGHWGAVTNSLAAQYTLRTYVATRSKLETNTVFERQSKAVKTVQVPNVWVGNLNRYWDGIKMDIEGGEFNILDAKALPPCNKLVMEYHTSMDTSMVHFARRIKYLRSRFKHVVYPAEFDRAIATGKQHHKPFFDRSIFAWGAK